ncbi:hypothetical protein TNIN_234981 [Trichonephila inaurata madagascariensis]|uniref:Uncharacterized protein n=1 Tax=Trichonephila inaurata madagascariensis TaxID=2747483 RepID=A0A8X6MCE6_9ARAC|nr:hypothetical protein TNIN_234981 [Trichonephila inaurata madagascariensis]
MRIFFSIPVEESFPQCGSLESPNLSFVLISRKYAVQSILEGFFVEKEFKEHDLASSMKRISSLIVQLKGTHRFYDAEPLVLYSRTSH